MGVDTSPENMGIRLSQPLFDVTTAEDKDLIFSSSFPMLKEDSSGVFNINGLSHAGNFIPVANHNLGYHPFFLVFDDQSKMRLGIEWQVDENTIYFNDVSPLSTPTNNTGNFKWIIYRLPLFTAYKSTIIDTTSTIGSEYSPDYGLKVAKEGLSADSTDLNDFTLHSRGRSPLIHEVNIMDWENTSTLTTHAVVPQFDYTPIAFGFVLTRSTGKVYNMVNGGQSPPVLSRQNSALTIASTGTVTVKSSIVVLKDPFLSPKTTEINY